MTPDVQDPLEIVDVTSDQMVFSDRELSGSLSCSMTPHDSDREFLNDSDDLCYEDSDAEREDMTIPEGQLTETGGIEGAVRSAESKFLNHADIDDSFMGEAADGPLIAKVTLQARESDADDLAAHVETVLGHAIVRVKDANQVTVDRRIKLAMDAASDDTLRVHTEAPALPILFEVAESRYQSERLGTIPEPARYYVEQEPAPRAIWINGVSENAMQTKHLPSLWSTISLVSRSTHFSSFVSIVAPYVFSTFRKVAITEALNVSHLPLGWLVKLTAYPQGTASTPQLQFDEVAAKYLYIRLGLWTLATTVSSIIVLTSLSVLS